MSLTQKQKRHLIGLAHKLKPVVMTGNAGLTEGVLAETEGALEHHELIKVKLRAERDERAEMQAAIVAATQAEVVQAVGQVLVLFRRNPKKPRVALPGS